MALQKKPLKHSDKLRHMLFKRRVMQSVYFLHHFSLPGSKGVPVWEVLRFFFLGVANGTLWQRAKGLAYSFLTAIPPLLIFLFTLIPLFPVEGLQQALLVELGHIFPSSIYNMIEPTITEVMGHRHNSLLSIGFATSIFLAGNGMHSMIMSFNYANPAVDTRPLLQRYAICFLLVFLLYILVIFIVVLQLGYHSIISWLFEHGFIAFTAFNRFIISFIRWIVLAFFALMVIGLIYYAAPGKKQRVGFFSIGTVIATVLLFGLTWGFQIYLTTFNRYNILYGSIGTLLVLMLWIYLNCLVLLVGYEINIAVAQGRIAMQHKAEKLKENLLNKAVATQDREAAPETQQKKKNN